MSYGFLNTKGDRGQFSCSNGAGRDGQIRAIAADCEFRTFFADDVRCLPAADPGIRWMQIRSGDSSANARTEERKWNCSERTSRRRVSHLSISSIQGFLHKKRDRNTSCLFHLYPAVIITARPELPRTRCRRSRPRSAAAASQEPSCSGRSFCLPR